MPTPTSASRSPRLDSVATVATVLVVLAALCAAWTGFSWYSAAHSDTLRYSRLRDEVLRSAEQDIINLNTLDYRHLDRDIKVWQQSATGDLLQQITQGRTVFEQTIQSARTVSTARVLEGAISELDDRAGKASVLVALQITVVPEGGKPTVKQNRFIGQLARAGRTWKVTSLGEAAVGSSGS